MPSTVLENSSWLCGPVRAKVSTLGLKPCKTGKSSNTPGTVRTTKAVVLTVLSQPATIFQLFRLIFSDDSMGIEVNLVNKYKIHRYGSSNNVLSKNSS